MVFTQKINPAQKLVGLHLLTPCIWILIARCGGEPAKELTVATVHMVRPSISIIEEKLKNQILEDTRLRENTTITSSAEGRCIVQLDGGGFILLDRSSDLVINDEQTISLKKGRIFADCQSKEALKIQLNNGFVKIIDSGVSIEANEQSKYSIYIYRGELSYKFPMGSGVARSGEILSIKGEGKSVNIEPAKIWDDWTGGIAGAGPTPIHRPESIGLIYARPPEALGFTRLPLSIRRHEVRVTIKGDLAITEVVQQFFNPQSITVEGIFKLKIPNDAILQRFAIDRKGKLIDGTIVERRTARAEYKKNVYAGSISDPALLEWVSPSVYQAKIYPIRAGEVRTVAYRYTQWLKPSGEDGRLRTYIYPMNHDMDSPRISEFLLVANLSGAKAETIQAGAGARFEKNRVIFSASDFVPRSNFYIRFTTSTEHAKKDEVIMYQSHSTSLLEKIKGAREEGYARIQFAIRTEDIKLQPAKNLSISVAIDMSAATDSAALNLAVAFLNSLFGLINKDDTIYVFAGDIDVEFVGDELKTDKQRLKATEAIKDRITEELMSRKPAGATDMGKLITRASSYPSGNNQTIVIYVGDGFPTVGELEIGSLKEKLSRLPNPIKLYGVALGDESNLDLLIGLCRDSGFADRITDSREASILAGKIVADGSIPTIENLSYRIDGAIERTYPPKYPFLKITQPFATTGKIIEGKPPKTLTIEGYINGKKFTKTYKIKREKIDDFGDLTSRWASHRLNALMDEGAGIESLIELGTRFQIITPYTSFYIPPEEKVDNLPETMPFQIFRSLEMKNTGSTGGNILRGIGGFFLPVGCSKVKDLLSSEGAQQSTRKFHRSVPPPLGYKTSKQEGAKATEGVASEREKPGTIGVSSPGRRKSTPGKAIEAFYDSVEPAESGKEAAPTKFRKKRKISPEEEMLSSIQQQVNISNAKVVFQTNIFSHKEPSLSQIATKCKEASLLPLSEKVAMWRERIGINPSLAKIMDAFNRAKANCEIKSIRDRRTFTRLVLGLLRSIPGKCSFYRSMKNYPSLALYIKRKIISSISSPQILNNIMRYCDFVTPLTSKQIENMLSKAKTIKNKIVICKKLIKLRPHDIYLKLKLLELLEEDKRIDEACNYAEEIRKNPYAIDQLRLRIGEFYLRIGKKKEAKKVFSEIVEFHPWSRTAREKLGRIYMTYGWYEDAYRQFETLAKMSPENEIARIYLARANIAAGRLDEGIRIMEQISQNEPVNLMKITPGQLAHLVASIQLMQMRIEAKEKSDEKLLKILIKKTRQMGVMQQAKGIKIILQWDHPDIYFKLRTKTSNGELSFPLRDASAEGFIWTFLDSIPQSPIFIQIERGEGSVVKESRATLYILMGEGTDKESLIKYEISLTDKKEDKIGLNLLPEGEIVRAAPSREIPL